MYGNLTSNAHAVNQVTTNAVDLGDRLTAVTLPGGGNTTTAFTFDALGRIATRTGPGAPTETYGYSGTSDTVGQISDGVTTTSSALSPDGERVATGSGGLTGFLLADLHGNQGAVVNAAESAIVGATRYDPYGLTAASWSGSGSVPTPWRYQGRLDVSANPADPLYVAGARDYLPASGTFISLDSFPGAIGTPASLNRYLYGAANPTSLIDPSGHYAMEGEGTDGSGTWVAETSEIFWQQRAADLLTTYTTDQYDAFNQTTQNLLVAQAGQQAWQWVMDSANNPYTNPFAIELAWDYGLFADPWLAQQRHGELAERLNDILLEDRDAARRNAEPGNTGWLDVTLTALLTAPYADFGEMGGRVGGTTASAPAHGISGPPALGTSSTITNRRGTIRSFVTDADRYFYRVYSSNPTGRFLTRVRPGSPAYARAALALPPTNRATYLQRVFIPAGTRLQRSRAAGAFGMRGGAEQFELIDELPSGYFGPGFRFE
jgi:RHS repeat-associated protein